MDKLRIKSIMGSYRWLLRVLSIPFFAVFVGVSNLFLFLALLPAALIPGRKSGSNIEREPGLSVIVPTWNGRALLEKYLPPTIALLEDLDIPTELVVVDDASTDDTIEFLKSNFPAVKVVANPVNLGFSGAVNAGIKASEHDLVMLLNNDAILGENFFRPALAHFDDPQVFAVLPTVYQYDDDVIVNEGLNQADFVKGLFTISHPEIARQGKCVAAPTPILYACGVAAILDKKKVEEIGYFDELYRPMYCEDLDISYVAWKWGWKVLHEPESRCEHLYRQTTKRQFDLAKYLVMLNRNLLLFTWKNIVDIPTLFSHFTYLFFRVMKSYASRNAERAALAKAYVQAFTRIPEVIPKRYRTQKKSVVGDKAVLTMSKPRIERGATDE